MRIIELCCAQATWTQYTTVCHCEERSLRRSNLLLLHTGIATLRKERSARNDMFNMSY